LDVKSAWQHIRETFNPAQVVLGKLALELREKKNGSGVKEVVFPEAPAKVR